MLTTFKRVFHFAFTDFYRNKDISIAAIFILTVTILLFTGLFLLHGISDFLVETIQNKIDITAYFKDTASEKSILDVKSSIEKISPDIKNVQYVSKEVALDQFTKKHEGSIVLANALKEVGDNPFLPSLNITTNGNPNLYEEISTMLKNYQFDSIIAKVDFSQKKDTIEKVFSITSSINTIGLTIGIILALITILIVFNTIKMIIDRSSEEMSTMRMVGASDWFVRSPFIIEGGIFGFIACGISFIITLIAIYFLSGRLESLMPGFNMVQYFISHFFIIILIQLLSGVGLGVIFSFIAVKKYLK